MNHTHTWRETPTKNPTPQEHTHTRTRATLYGLWCEIVLRMHALEKPTTQRSVTVDGAHIRTVWVMYTCMCDKKTDTNHAVTVDAHTYTY